MVVAYDQITSRADQELAALDKSQDQIRSQVVMTQQGIAVIQTQASNRNTQLAALRQEVKALEDTHDRVALELDLAQGSDLAAPLKRKLSQLVAALQEKRGEIASREKLTFAEEAKEAGQLQRFRSDLAAHEKHLQEIGTKRAAVQAARDQFFAAQRLAESAAVKARLAELNNRLQQAKLAEQEAHAALLNYSDEALRRLAPWPEELQRQITPLLAFENSTTRVIEAAIHLRDLLIEQGKQVNTDSDLLRKLGIWESLPALLEMQVKEVWSAVNLNNNDKPQRFLEQREKLQRCCKRYVEDEMRRN